MQLILSSDSDSSPGVAPWRLGFAPTNDTVPEASYEVFLSFAGAYASSFFHTAKAMAAI